MISETIEYSPRTLLLRVVFMRMIDDDELDQLCNLRRMKKASDEIGRKQTEMLLYEKLLGIVYMKSRNC